MKKPNQLHKIIESLERRAVANMTRYENLLLQSWWLLKEPIVVLSEGKVLKLLNLRIRTGCVPAS